MDKYYQPQEYEEPIEDQDYGQQIPIEDQDYGQQVPMMSPELLQSMEPQPQQPPYNPYYNGIRNAIKEARRSFASTNEQRNRALRAGILSFGQSLGGIEREKGFKNNMLAAGRALAPGIQAYDQINAASESMNEQLANKMLAEKQAYEARIQQQQNIEADRALKMKQMTQQYGLSERELMERIRHNQAQEAMARGSLMERMATQELEKPEMDTNRADLINLLDNAERVIRAKGDAAQYGVGSRWMDRFSPVGYRKNQDQAAIDTIGQMLQGDLFKKAFGYNSTAEFEHTPTISSENSPETNLEIIQQLRNRFGLNDDNSSEYYDSNDGNRSEYYNSNDDNSPEYYDSNEWILMKSPEGEEAEVHIEDVPMMQQRGNRVIQ